MWRVREILHRLSRSDRKSSSDTFNDPSKSNNSPSTSRISFNEESSLEKEVGAEVLHDGTRGLESGLDIVFVHGLMGHRTQSWTTKNGNICWPRDLLPKDFPEARIITWGLWGRGDVTFNTLPDLAEALLRAISKLRHKTARPIIFIGHGIGGLIIKETLVTAGASRIFGSVNQLGYIYSRTIGVIFLGTPHSPNGSETLGEVIAQASKLVPRQLPKDIMQKSEGMSEALMLSRDTFILMSRDMEVVCVRESHPTPKGLMIPPKVATYEASRVTVEDFPCDHFELAQFWSSQDANYQRLISHIDRIFKGPPPDKIKEVAERNQQILDALYFDTMMDRHKRIQQADDETCSWILSSNPEDETESRFLEYLTSKDPIFWISGKAGSGKSTLMKYVFHSERFKQELLKWADGQDLIMASFFIGEGGHLQKTREGLLRTLLYQILWTRPSLIPVCFPGFFNCPWPPPMLLTSVVNLTQAFYALFAGTGESLRLVVLIDGLDDYRLMDKTNYYTKEDMDIVYDKSGGDGSFASNKWIADSQQDVVDLVNVVGDQDKIKMIASSRELPVFEKALAGRPRLRIHEHSEKAIATYCSNRLEQAVPGLTDVAWTLCMNVAQRSKGNMLWARLVIDLILAKDSLRSLKSTMDSLPTRLDGLNGLYMHMIENLNNLECRREAGRILQLVLRAHQPPPLIRLAFAYEGCFVDSAMRGEGQRSGKLLLKLDNHHTYMAEDLQRRCKRMKDTLTALCTGLLELETESGATDIEQRVMFIHQTAKEFTGRQDVWEKLLYEPINTTETDLSLLSGCIRHLKCVEVLRPVCEQPHIALNPETWLIIANALRYAGRIDPETNIDRQAYCELLDELDQTSQRAWVQSLRRRVPLFEDPQWTKVDCPNLCKKHWASFEPMDFGDPPFRRDFLSIAIQANLVTYVSTKLSQLDAHERKTKAQELLQYAVAPSYSGTPACLSLTGSYIDFHHDMPDARFLNILLDDTGAVCDQDSWAKALKAGRCYFARQHNEISYLIMGSAGTGLMQNRQRWVSAIKAMLERGADPELIVESRWGGEGASNRRLIPAMDSIKETLEGESDYVVDLKQLERLVDKRGSAKPKA